MSHFKAKKHRIRFCIPDAAGEAYSAPPSPLAGFKGACFYGEGEEEREGKGGEGKGKEGKWRGGVDIAWPDL